MWLYLLDGLVSAGSNASEVVNIKTSDVWGLVKEAHVRLFRSSTVLTATRPDSHVSFFSKFV
jgi:hypothetical protein